METRNLICAGALLRLQLDTALRFYAAFRVEKPHDFALAVLDGKRVRDLKDLDGQKMTDDYLVRKLGASFPGFHRCMNGLLVTFISQTFIFQA